MRVKCGENRPDTEYVLSLSYGKDSIATIEACHRLGQRIDRIVHAEVWATQDIPAELPPMVEFKEKADKIIFERYGLKVERVCAMKKNVRVFTDPCEWAGNSPTRNTFTQYHQEKKTRRMKGCIEDSQCNEEVGARNSNMADGSSKKTYEDVFYRKFTNSKTERKNGMIYGFPQIRGGWCTGELKTTAVQSVKHSLPKVDILGIAIDEPKRVERHSKENILLPLVEIGWTEADCRKWCEENELLSPTYTTSMRGGCWFCHNQGVQQLRLLRRDYPEYWALLMKWDLDSPVTFHADGHTVHDFDKRFALEDEGLLKENELFRWTDIEHPQLRIDWSNL